MAQRFNFPREQVFSDLGSIGAGYKLHTYEAGTTTPLATYSDTALSVANANPTIADSAGRFGDIFVNDLKLYKAVLKDADDNTIYTADPVDPKTFTLTDFDPRPTSFWGTTAGTADAFTLTADPDVNSYSSTQTFFFACHLDNNASATMAIINSTETLSALTLKKYDGEGSKVDLEELDLLSGQRYEATNDGTNIVILNPERPYVDGRNIFTATNEVRGVSYLLNPITISNGTDADHDIDFTAGNFQFNDGSGQGKMTAKTGELDAAFGTGDGMLDTGTIAADSTYHLFTVYNPTTSDSKPLTSLSKTSPTMTLPDADGYTILGKRIAALRTDGSANIRGGSWLFGTGIYEFFYTTRINELNTTSVTTSGTTFTLEVPEESIAQILCTHDDVSTNLQIGIRATDETFTLTQSTADLITVSSGNVTDIAMTMSKYIRTDSSGQIFLYSSVNATTGGTAVNTLGWKEYL